MSDDELAQLKARVAELEKQLKARSQPTDISADEIAAFRKVSDALVADWGDCGINECYRPPVLRCVTRCIARCIVRCIHECSCGPCGVGGPIGGGLGRFEEFGG